MSDTLRNSWLIMTKKHIARKIYISSKYRKALVKNQLAHPAINSNSILVITVEAIGAICLIYTFGRIAN